MWRGSKDEGAVGTTGILQRSGSQDSGVVGTVEQWGLWENQDGLGVGAECSLDGGVDGTMGLRNSGVVGIGGPHGMAPKY